MDAEAGIPRKLGGLEGLAWAALDAAPDGVLVVDGVGTVLMVNRQAEKLFGYARDDLLGRSVDDLVPEPHRGRHRAHRTRYRAAPTARAMGEGDLLRGRRRDGTEFPVEISLSAFGSEDGQRIIATVRDVTARIEVEAHAALIQQAIDQAADGVFICDEQTLAFTHVSARAAAMHGYDRQELTGMTPLHLAPRLDATQLEHLIAPLLAGQDSVVFATTGLDRDGREFPVEINISRPPAAPGATSRPFVAIVRDVTDRVEAADRVATAERRTAILADRERMARDLHDTVIQELFALGLDVQSTAGRLHDVAGAERLGATVDRIDEVIRHIRVAIFGLSARQEWGRGLKGEILTVARDAQRALEFEPEVVFDGAVDTVPDAVAAELLPTLREALSNVARHANARRVRIEVTADNGTLDLLVLDDGQGLRTDPDHRGGRGLGNMARRAELLGGQCAIVSGPAGGTEVRWQVPLAH